MKENDVQKVYWAAYEDGEVMESDDGILLISFDKETVEHYPSLPNQVLQVMICRPPTSRPVDAALKSPPEIEGLDEAIDGVAEYQQLRQRYGFTKKITQHISVVLEAARRYAALPHCPDGFVCVSKDRLTQLLEMKDKVTEKCKDHEWSLWGTGCLYAGNFCLIRKGGYVDHEEAWDDAAYFIVNAADFCDEIRLLIAAAEGNK